MEIKIRNYERLSSIDFEHAKELTRGKIQRFDNKHSINNSLGHLNCNELAS